MIPYSLHVALLIMISLLFYKLMLKRETYHTLNRVVLLACLAVAFILPFVPVPQQFSFIEENAITASLVKPTAYHEATAPAVTKPAPSLLQQAAAPATNSLPEATTASFDRENMVKWAFWIYWGGVVIFGVNLLIQLIVVSYKIFKSEVIYDGKYRIIELNDDKAPCSFGNYIFINPAKYEWDTYDQILIHEKVHVQQYHTLDLIIAELMVVFQWFNPLAWLYRKEIENNLEFLTDHTVIDRHKVKQDDYQLNLLKVSVPNFSMRITTNYNQSLLKQRIMMMNSRRSNIHIVWKYFAIIPLFICMVCLLNKPVAISANLSQQQQQPAAVKQVNKVRQTNKKLVSTQKTKTTNKVNNLLSGSMPTIANDEKKLSKGGTLTSGSLINKINLKNDGKNFTETVARLNKGVSTSYAQDFSFSGDMDFTADDIIKLQANGVSASYVHGIRSSGFVNFTADDIIKLQHNGVSPSYVQGIGSSGLKNLIATDIIKLQASGVPPSYIQGIGSSGFKNFTANDIIDLHAKGVSPSYVQGIGSSGYKNLTASDIIKLQASGVSSSYIQGLSPK